MPDLDINPAEQLPVMERVQTALQEVGLSSETVAPHILERMALLEELTPTLQDEVAAIGRSSKIFEQAAAAGHPYTEEEQQIVRIGTLFTDIGKTGPRAASAEQARWVARMFAVENNPPEEVQAPVARFLKNHFPDEAQTAAAELEAIGVSVDGLTMRDFYNLHTTWTRELLTDSGVPADAIPAAAAHHRLRGDDPGHLFLEGSDAYAQQAGHNVAYDRPEKLVSILDMYDAYCRRGGLDHRAAMERLEGWLQKTWDGRYAQDPEIREIMADLDAAMAPQTVAAAETG
jgi:hypothetical protein